MNVKLKILRKVLEEAINNIDAGNSNHSDDELEEQLKLIFLLLINNLYLIIMILKLLNKIF